jgi:hypothetical integral membrane protein (TIGR02206 family)
MPPRFVPFGPPHLTAIALAVLVPLVLAPVARRNRVGGRADRLIRLGLTLFLVTGWVGWLWNGWHTGLLGLDNGLPLNLCDWAEAALIVALLSRHQFAYELGYFWGLGGTLQGLLTPPLYYGWPDPQFVFFFIQHGGVVAALLYLTVGTRLRPTLRSLPRVIAATLFYAGFAGLVDVLLGGNYGFLRAKPAGTNLLTFLSPWPWYIPQLVAVGLVFVLIYYAPFALADWLRRRRAARSGA